MLKSEKYAEFLKEIRSLPDEEDSLKDFCRRKIIHGTPYIFMQREDDYYYFLKQIAVKYEIPFNSIHISGSGKLGFSFIKKTDFSLNSDIDVTIISANLFDKIMDMVGDFQISLRQSSIYLTESQQTKYFDFLKYSAMGWIRPDLLPKKSYPSEFRKEWFDFFRSISYDNCIAGNYKVTAGVFKSYECFEKYSLIGLDKLTIKLP
ncbi:hypothetical protein [Rahnella sp. PD4]|uniref:hypothetical protein n=1 Tax=Rahnella sp. PD4 TaxID=3368611 RepID=UPI003BA317B5